MLWPNGNLLLNNGPKADGTILSKTKTSSHRSPGDWLGGMEKPFIRVGLGRCHRSRPTKGSPGRSSLSDGQRHSTNRDFRYTKARDGFLYAISWNQVEDGRMRPCRLALWPQATESLHALAFKARAPWRKPAPFLEPKIKDRAPSSVTSLANNRVFAHQLEFSWSFL